MSRDTTEMWLKRQHFYWPKGKPHGGATHLVTMADGKQGGVLSIADDQHGAFLLHIANDWAHTCDQCSWSIHENATRYSRVYFKLNFDEAVASREGEMDASFLEKVVRVLQKRVIAHFPEVAKAVRSGAVETRGCCVVLAAPPSFAPEPSEAQLRRKISFHIVFPYLYADLNQLLQLHTATVDALDRQRHEVPPPGGANSWDIVIDANVYTTRDAGLCMPGRSTLCAACANKNNDGLARAYAPMLALDTRGECDVVMVQSLRSDGLKMLRLCTIRMPYQYTNDPPFHGPKFTDTPIIYTIDEAYIRANLPRSENDRSTNPGTSQSLAARESRGLKRKAASQSVDPLTGLKRGAKLSKGARQDLSESRVLERFPGDHHLAEVFQSFLRNCGTWPQYRNICVIELRRLKSKGQPGTKPSEPESMEALMLAEQSLQNMTKIDDVVSCNYMIFVQGGGCRYCQNIDGEHQSAKVYFFANYEGIAQRCFCNEQTNRSSVFCSAYTSQFVKWTSSAHGYFVRETFFGAANCAAIGRSSIGRSSIGRFTIGQQPTAPRDAPKMGDLTIDDQRHEMVGVSDEQSALDHSATSEAHEWNGPITAEQIDHLLRTGNRPGVYDPPMIKRRAPQPAAEQPLAQAIRERQMRERERQQCLLPAADSVSQLPKRAELPPESLARLAPPDNDTGSVRSTEPNNNAFISSSPPPPQSHSSTTVRAPPREVSFFSPTRGRILKSK